MIQVWLIDANGFYTGKVDFVNEPNEFQITKPYEIGYIKGKWDFELQEWIEGATTEEIAEWKQANKIDILEIKPKSNKELTLENEQLWETVQFLLKQVDLIPKEAINE